MNISIVVPAYNEARRIEGTLRRIQHFLDDKKAEYEIIVVDDGSKDNTQEIVRRFGNKRIRLLSNGRNQGKGYSVRKGMLAATKDYVLFTDADLSTPIEELNLFERFWNKYDILIGSRRVAGASIPVPQPFYRRWPGAVFPLLVSFLIMRGIRDTQCGFKMFRREVARDLFSRQRLPGFSFDAEILYLAQKRGYRIKEVPVIWVNALDSKLNAVTDSAKMFLELLLIRYHDLRGRYQ
jgi:dolichyl-phosphate beta-glucosyltransferase